MLSQRACLVRLSFVDEPPQVSLGNEIETGVPMRALSVHPVHEVRRVFDGQVREKGALIALQRHETLIRWSLWRGSHSESCDVHHAIRAKLEPHQVTCGVQMALGVRSQRLSQTQ